jgi:hypothetical protein
VSFESFLGGKWRERGRRKSLAVGSSLVEVSEREKDFNGRTHEELQLPITGHPGNTIFSLSNGKTIHTDLNRFESCCSLFLLVICASTKFSRSSGHVFFQSHHHSKQANEKWDKKWKDEQNLS